MVDPSICATCGLRPPTRLRNALARRGSGERAPDPLRALARLRGLAPRVVGRPALGEDYRGEPRESRRLDLTTRVTMRGNYKRVSRGGPLGDQQRDAVPGSPDFP